MGDSDAEFSDAEEEICTESLKSLRAGTLPVKNSDGRTLRCPYSPSRKKQAYLYKDLLQHADAVGKGNRGAKAVGCHRALAEYLRTDLSPMASVPNERAHKLQFRPPQEDDVEDLLLYPWSGVVYNIQIKQDDDGFWVGPSTQELKSVFKRFQPEKAKAIWGPAGHMGVGVIIFQKDFDGWTRAQAFEKCFIGKRHGKKDWEINKNYDLGTDLYGWLARKEDYEGRGNDAIAKFFREKGPLELKDIRMIAKEMTAMHEQRLNFLTQTVSEKNMEFQKVVEEVKIAKMRAEDMRRQLEEKHRQELEEVKHKAERSIHDHMMLLRSREMNLQSTKEKLSKRLKELEEKEELMQSQVERMQLEQEKRENTLRLEMLTRQKEVQAVHQADMMKLMEKHEKEAGEFEKWVQQKKLRMAEKHLDEFDNHRLGEIRNAQKFAEALNDPTLYEESALKELQERFASVENQKAELEEKVVELKDDVEFQSSMVNDLTKKERMATNELVAAKNAAVEAISSVAPEYSSVCVKMMGEIATEPWIEACKKVYKNHTDGWGSAYSEKHSLWAELIRDPQFDPFKTVLNGESRERHVDYSNEKLKKLKEELGTKVVDTVISALEEIEKFNPSGRYPVRQLWNTKEGRVATLAESIECLSSFIKPKQKRRKAR